MLSKLLHPAGINLIFGQNVVKFKENKSVKKFLTADYNNNEVPGSGHGQRLLF